MGCERVGVRAEMRMPPPAPCAVCGRQLAASRQECPHCFGESPAVSTAGYADVERLLRRARARMLFGLWMLPIIGIVLQPLALESALRARAAYARSELDEQPLLRRIQRHQMLAVFLFGLSVVITLAVLRSP